MRIIIIRLPMNRQAPSGVCDPFDEERVPFVNKDQVWVICFKDRDQARDVHRGELDDDFV